MATFDPSVILSPSQNQADPVAAQQKALNLYDTKNKVQLNSLTLQQAKQEQADIMASRDILKNADLSTEKGVNQASEKLSQAGLYDQAMKVKKDAASQQMMNLDVEAKKLAVAQEQVTPMISSIDTTLTRLQPKKALYDKGQITQSEMDAATMKEMMPELLRLKLDNPQLSPYIDQFMKNPRNMTYEGLVATENQTKNGRDMAKARLDEIKEAQNQQRLDLSDRREQANERNIQSLIAARSEKQEENKAKQLDPETANFMAKQYVDTGDKSVFTGMARSAGDMAALRRAVRTYAESKGLTPSDVSAKVAEFNGFMSEQRALGTRQAAIETAASEAAKVLPIAQQASDAVPRTKWVPVNQIIQKGKVMSSDKDLARFGQANLTLANVYSRAMNPTGSATVSGRDHALDMLSTATSQNAYNGVLDIISQEIEAARAAPPEIRQEVFKQMSGGKADHETIMDILSGVREADTASPAKRPGQQTSGKTLTPSSKPTKQMTDDELIKKWSQ